MSQIRRDDDRLIGELIGKLDTYMKETNQWRIDHDASAKEFRDDIYKRLLPFEDWANTANLSWKLVIGAVAFTSAMFKAWDWIHAHFIR